MSIREWWQRGVQEGKRGKVFLYRVKHEKTMGSDVDDEVLDRREEPYLVGGEWGRGRKGREENGEGEEVNVTYPVGEAWRDRWQ